jgi:hypothetical protein
MGRRFGRMVCEPRSGTPSSDVEGEVGAMGGDGMNSSGACGGGAAAVLLRAAEAAAAAGITSLRRADGGASAVVSAVSHTSRHVGVAGGCTGCVTSGGGGGGMVASTHSMEVSVVDCTGSGT